MLEKPVWDIAVSEPPAVEELEVEVALVLAILSGLVGDETALEDAVGIPLSPVGLLVPLGSPAVLVATGPLDPFEGVIL